MNEQELGFNAWVLLGNVLQALLRGPVAMTAAAEALDRSGLERLEAALVDVQPPGMLAAVQGLSLPDREFLARACAVAFELAGGDAAWVLGMDQAAAEPVLELLTG